MAFIPTDEQKAIAQAIATGTGNVAVNAGAGTGKSTTAKWIVRETVSPNASVLFCVFNRKNKEELEIYTRELGRRGVVAKTFNGMGYSAMMKALGKRMDQIDIDDDKYRRYADEWAEYASLVSEPMDTEEDRRQEREDAATMLTKLVHFFMVNTTFERSNSRALKVLAGIDPEIMGPSLVDHNPNNLGLLGAIVYRYRLGGLNYKENEELVIRQVAKLIERGHADMMMDRPRVSFTEQIYWTVVKGWKVWQSQLVIADEAQDMSPLERALVDMHVYWRGSGRVMFIGDPQQAIYAFKGADNCGFQNSMKFWGVEKQYPLSLSRRCPKKIAILAREHKPGYRATDEAPDGIIVVTDEASMLETLRPGDAVISRVRAPMITLWRKLIALKKPAAILGSDVTGSITTVLRAIARRKDFEFRKLDELLTVYELRKIERMKRAKKPEQDIDAFADQMATVRGAIEAVPDAQTIDELIAGIKAIFKKDDGNGDDKEKILIMTGHGAKGLEFKRVFNITPDKFPMSWRDQSNEEFEQELNLDYVQKTRTIQEYYFVTNNKEQRQQIENDLKYAFNPMPEPAISLGAAIMVEEAPQPGVLSDTEWCASEPFPVRPWRVELPIPIGLPGTPSDTEWCAAAPLSVLDQLREATAHFTLNFEVVRVAHLTPADEWRNLITERDVLQSQLRFLTDDQLARLHHIHTRIRQLTGAPASRMFVRSS